MTDWMLMYHNILWWISTDFAHSAQRNDTVVLLNDGAILQCHCVHVVLCVFRLPISQCSCVVLHQLLSIVVTHIIFKLHVLFYSPSHIIYFHGTFHRESKSSNIFTKSHVLTSLVIFICCFFLCPICFQHLSSLTFLMRFLTSNSYCFLFL